MEFSCAGGKTEVCFNGGVCSKSNVTLFESCSCPDPRYGPDYSWFHDSSCTLPIDFYLGQFIENCILSSIVIFLLLKLVIGDKSKRTKERKAVFWSICGVASIWLFTLGVLVQNGNFEIAGVGLVGCLLASTMCALYLIDMQLRALNGVDGLVNYKLLMRTLNATVVCCFMASIAIAIAWLVLCRTLWHNTVTRTSLCSIWFWNTLFVGEIVYFCSKLLLEIQTLQASQNNQLNSSAFTGWDSLIVKIRGLKLAMLLYYGMLASGIAPIVFLHFILGSAPYGFLLINCALHCPVVLCFGVHFLLTKQQGARGKNKVDDSVTDKMTPNVTPVNDNA
jgi:hypothetical protein